MLLDSDRKTTCGTCKEAIPVDLPFCASCSAPAPHTKFAFRLLKPIANCVLLALVFYLAGYRASHWTVFACLAYFYVHAVCFSLRTEEWERTALLSFLVPAAIFVALESAYDLNPLWFGGTVLAALFVLISSRLTWHRATPAFSLLGWLFLEGQAEMLGLPRAESLESALNSISEALTQRASADLWQSLIALASWRFLWVFLMAVLIIGIRSQYARMRGIRVGRIIDPPPPFPTVEWADGTEAVRAEIAHMPAFVRPVFHAALNTFRAFARGWVIVANTMLSFAYRATVWVLDLVDRIVRFAIHCFLLVYAIFEGMVVAVADAAMDSLRALGTVSVSLIVPLSLTVLLLKCAFLLARKIILNLASGANLLVVGEMVGYGATVVALIYLGPWTVRPYSHRRMWWRPASPSSPPLDLLVIMDVCAEKLRVFGVRAGNYLQGFAPILFFAYMVTLFVFDTIGLTTGAGPYQFGFAMLVCATVLGFGVLTWWVFARRSPKAAGAAHGRQSS